LRRKRRGEGRDIMGRLPIFDQAKKEGRSMLTEFESKKILKQVGISVVETR